MDKLTTNELPMLHAVYMVAKMFLIIHYGPPPEPLPASLRLRRLKNFKISNTSSPLLIFYVLQNHQHRLITFCRLKVHMCSNCCLTPWPLPSSRGQPTLLARPLHHVNGTRGRRLQVETQREGTRRTYPYSTPRPVERAAPRSVAPRGGSRT